MNQSFNLLSAIAFPSLDPVAIRLGPVAVRWYGLAYLSGFVLATLLLRGMVRRGRLRIGLEQLTDLIVWLVAGVMVGGRLGWWLFYHRSAGVPEPWYELFAVWHGGMSFHGGVIGAGTTVYTGVTAAVVVPEPATLGLAGLASLGLLSRRRRRARAARTRNTRLRRPADYLMHLETARRRPRLVRVARDHSPAFYARGTARTPVRRGEG